MQQITQLATNNPIKKRDNKINLFFLFFPLVQIKFICIFRHLVENQIKKFVFHLCYLFYFFLLIYLMLMSKCFIHIEEEIKKNTILFNFYFFFKEIFNTFKLQLTLLVNKIKHTSPFSL